MHNGLFTYAWDLEARGDDAALGEIADADFASVNLAAQYHAGKFLLPRNPRRRVYFQEGGAVFFEPDPSRYGRLQPRVHSLVAETGSPLARVVELGRRHGLSTTAWTVCLHNSWLGEQFPDTTMHTAFGDPLIHSLSPAHPDARAYIIAVLGDMVSRHDVTAVQLESPGYMGFLHGFHHEIIGVPLDAVQQRLLSLSFNPVEIAGATAAGIEAEAVRQRVASLLDGAWNRGVKLMDGDGPTAAATAVLDDPDVQAYAGWLVDQEISLAAEMRETIRTANPATTIWHFAALDGSERDARLVATGDGILSGYAASDGDAIDRARRAQALGKPARGAIRAIAPDTTDPAAIAPRAAAWTSANVEGIDVYNYGLMPGTIWETVAAALRQGGQR